jgi:ACT domain-containing protein
MADDPPPKLLDDADRTDTLPVLDSGSASAESVDDAVRQDRSAVPPTSPSSPGHPSFVHGSRLDLPRLDETVRSVEDRIARQVADHAALTRTLERSQDSEATAVQRANELAAEAGGLRAALEAERERAREIERALFERNTAVELGRARIEETQRECARLGEEARSLKDALATRDATIVQVLNSLGERDAQLTALQREHASIVPDLSAKARAAAQLEAEAKAAQAKITELQLALDARTAESDALQTRLARNESQLAEALREIGELKARSNAYLETLQSREWRRSYEHSRWRAADAQPQALQAAVIALEAQRDELSRKLAELAASPKPTPGPQPSGPQPSGPQPSAPLASAPLPSSAAPSAPPTSPGQPIASAPPIPPALPSELAANAPAFGEQATQEALAAAQRKIDEQAAQIANLEAGAETTQEEMTVLLAHLQAARRQQTRDAIDTQRAAERKRLTDELGERQARVAELETENRQLQVNVERLRGALDEREFLIRRLERNESNNASALGRLQNTIERLGAAALPPADLADLELTPRPLPPPRPSTGVWEPAKLVRIDGGHAVTYVLQRRNQVGRAPGIDVHIDSSSVSRLHALIVTAPGGAIIEDVKSTNGTYINGRRVTRQRLHDGDLLTIGEAQFRFVAEALPAAARKSGADAARVTEAGSAATTAPATPGAPVPPDQQGQQDQQGLAGETGPPGAPVAPEGAPNALH